MRSMRLIRHAAALCLLLPAAAASGQETKPETKPSTRPAEKLVYVVMGTSMGDIVLELNNEMAPITVANFVAYTESDFYDGTIFHRVMDGFMIQGGGFEPGLSQKEPADPITNEWQNGLKNKRGTIAMARLPRRPDSATAQFFINVKDNAGLDMPRDGAGYAVFGRVVAGMDVVDAIRVVPTTTKPGPGRRPMENVPVEDVVIKTVDRITADEAKKRIEADKAATTKPAKGG